MITALSGGVGGARLSRGLADELPTDGLTVVVNTGDDFEHMGLRIMPDFDSVAYAVAGWNDEQRGWGRAGESWHCMQALGELGGDTWFSLGDKDLALHLLRRELLAQGASICEVAAQLTRRMGIGCALVPMCDEPVQTRVLTDAGELAFQDYFVRRRCEPTVRAFRFAGSERAQPAPAWFAPLAAGASGGVVLCPSNPFVSIDPILSLQGVREALRRRTGPVVAVSPIVGGAAVKGPLAKMLRELGREVTPLAVAEHYGDWLDGFVLDQRDEFWADALRARGLQVAVCDTVMPDRAASRRVARACLQLLQACAPPGVRRGGV